MAVDSCHPYGNKHQSKMSSYVPDQETVSTEILFASCFHSVSRQNMPRNRVLVQNILATDSLESG